MDILIYDGSFNGFLTVVFEIYKYKLTPENITSLPINQSLYTHIRSVDTEETKSERVQKALKKKISPSFFHLLATAFLSGKEGVEMLLFRLIKKIFVSAYSIEQNFADKDVHDVIRLNGQFHKEVHRMYAFVRFEKYDNDLFFSAIEPEYNMIPYISPFFVDRFANQTWLIYDTKRKKGIFYDRNKVSIILAEPMDFIKRNISENKVSEQTDEQNCQALWKTYFSSVNISERKNLKLQRSHMPKKYWRFLTEMTKPNTHLR